MRNAYKVLAEKYNTLYTEERVVKQTPYTKDELSVLKTMFDFEPVKDNPAQLRRIVAAGEVEDIIKYSDNTFVRMTEDGRGVFKHEYKSFFELTKALNLIYKPNRLYASKQDPRGKSMPGGSDLSTGGDTAPQFK
jgi:hypothetical protein